MATVPPCNDVRIDPDGSVGRSRWRILAIILGTGLVLRLIAAGIVQWYAEQIGKPCLFGDTFIYWELAQKIRAHAPFEVNQFGVPHFALRTPGYPLFLAVCQTIFGPSYLAVRLIQAVLNTIGVMVLYLLFQRILPVSDSSSRVWSSALIGTALAAVEPYSIGLEALILSEGVFIPLMLAGLWGLSVLWKRDDSLAATDRDLPLAVATGVIHGLAVLVRPSWVLMVPILLVVWVVSAKPAHHTKSWRNGGIFTLAIVLTMMPWWVRNSLIFGRFVPTAMWVGASLYDGISPQATGASDMRFLAEPGVVELDETAQDRVLKQRSIAFARTNPTRVIELAWVKFLRFWSPWPNAETLKSPIAFVFSALVTCPLFALATIGLWDRRRDIRTIILLAGPLFYFLMLHLVFVSSIRYRIPGFIPVLGLAAIGWQHVLSRIPVKKP